MRNITITLLIMSLILLGIAIGCSSHSSNPVSAPPAKETAPKLELPSTEIESTMLGHELLGVWNMTFDPEKMTATIEPNRELGWHFNVKSMIPAPGIKINSFNPATWTIDCDVTLRNPYAISGYDIRLIIFTTDAGRTLNNPDNWTPLYDISGGDTINPFKAYAKEQPLRVFAGPVSYTENLVINLAGNFNVQFAVDASYPSNCQEPYAIYGFTQEEPLYDRQDAEAAVFLYAHRWNPEKWMRVFVDCPEVMDEALELDTDDMEYYYGDIVNFHDAPAGEYPALISAHTDNPVPLYDIENIIVTEKPIYGWATMFSDDLYLGGLETDGGNIYFALNDTGRIAKYTKDSEEVWVIDADNQGPFGDLEDLDIHPDFYNLYATGAYYECGSFKHSAMSVFKCYKGTQGGVDSNYVCDYWKPIVMTEIASDSTGNAYLTGTWSNDDDTAIWKVYSGSLNTVWTYGIGGDEGSATISDIECSSFNTIYGCGQFWGTQVDLDPTDGEYIMEPFGTTDSFLSEWNAAGSYVKIVRWGGSGDDSAYVYTTALAIDDSGNVFVGGRFDGTVDFDPRLFGYDIKTSTDAPDFYISKFNSNFTFQDTIQLVCTNYTYLPEITDIATDQDGNIYVCGYFGATIDFDPGPGTVERTSQGSATDIFLAKYSNNLDFQWVQVWGTTSSDWGTDVVYDKVYNYVYLGGAFTGTIDFDPGEGVFELTADTQHPFVMRLLPNGMWEY